MRVPEIRAEMRRLVLRERWRIETVARRFGVHHSTVRRALETPPEDTRAAVRASVLEPFKPYIVERLTAAPLLTSTRLMAELQPRGYKHGVAALRRYVAKVRQPKFQKVYLRIETEPGEQAQVDWGSFGHLRIGSSQRPLSAFSMVLSWSRAMYVDFALDQRMETFLAMHRRALEAFGGVPKQILYDNLKSVVLHRVGNTVQFNPRFLSFAGQYLFEPTAAPVRYPEAKGRVENSIKYIRHAFFYGRSFTSLDDVRRQVAMWLEATANARVHAATRERPVDRLLVERPRLHALPARPFDVDFVTPLVVTKEARVRFDTNTYSVPSELVGKTVHLRADGDTVRVVHDGVEVARHERCWERHRAIEATEHIDELLKRRKAALGPKRRDRLAALSTDARLYLQEVSRRRMRLDAEVRKLMRLLRQYSESELESGMSRALAQRTFGARYVRALIDQERFARGLSQPPEPVITGNEEADSLDIQPHDLESYDELVPDNEEPEPAE